MYIIYQERQKREKGENTVRKSEELHMTIETDKNVYVNEDAFFFTLFGMSVEALTRELRENKKIEYEGVLTDLIAI